jgi:hypothetical protein
MPKRRLTPSLQKKGAEKMPLDFIRYKRRASEIGEALYVPYPPQDTLDAFPASIWKTSAE